MQSSDSNHFFQSDAALAQRQRKADKASNKHGKPLRLKSKILAVIAGPTWDVPSIFMAESAGCVRRLQVSGHEGQTLQPAESSTVYRGPKAPVTCLALGGKGDKTIFAGSWDKDIWSWDISTARPAHRYSGHGDFVKAVVCASLAGTEILMSGGADKKIIVWDIESGRRLHTIQDAVTPMLAVQDLAIDPVLSTRQAIVLLSASSDPHIRRWKITLDDYMQLPESYHDRPHLERLTIKEHETSVYKVAFDSQDEEANLWTASADGTAKCLARSHNFVAQDSLAHGEHVRALAVTEQWIITAGRDENIKVWGRATGQLYCVLQGHFDEVTDLVVLPSPQGCPAKTFCSVSIDGTVRTWPLAQKELDQVVSKMQDAQQDKETKGDNLLTADEEAELAELMDE
ncbi:hypothetical protein CDD81_6739 [Ophiocordyceps australis]|uniref:Uncharacterized protein n=1 Tax=Ophiocordyceps australis TaxID=1399860 RepID=A0A2C5Y7A4_9HYPO|nr:hypothetical protein CDD81_6739 [Ophiocordyceps australis]